MAKAPSARLKERLLKIDNGFYSKEHTDGKSTNKQVDFCQVLSKIDGKHILEYSTRIIVPKASLKEAQEAIARIDLAKNKVVAFEDVIEEFKS